MNKFISCDWGTSSFRLRLVDGKNPKFISVESNELGIANVHKSWQTRASGENRIEYYFQIIRQQIHLLEQRSGETLTQIPIIISGMASSSLGMIELPYQSIPISVTGTDLKIELLKAKADYPDIFIVPGVRSGDDVMRGEETQLIGCDHDLLESRTFIFPGTHSKHVLVDQGNFVNIRTYMTGEFFQLLLEKSILSVSVEKPNEKMVDLNSFRKGVAESKESNILHSSFLVRTNDLFGKYSKQQNYFFLSGLLIGTELRELHLNSRAAVTLVANAAIKELYSVAFESIYSTGKLNTIDVDQALVKGQFKLLSHLRFSRRAQRP